MITSNYKLNCDVKYVIMKRQQTHQKLKDKPQGLHLFIDFFNGVLYSYSMLLMVSLPKMATGWSLRLMVGWYWLFCTLVAVSYRASMTAILANPAPRSVTLCHNDVKYPLHS